MPSATMQDDPALAIDFGWKPDTTKRDGWHGLNDPIVCNGQPTTLRALHRAGLLEARVYPSEEVPPYTEGGKPAHMAVLIGTALGWEISAASMRELFGQEAPVVVWTHAKKATSKKAAVS